VPDLHYLNLRLLVLALLRQGCCLLLAIVAWDEADKKDHAEDQYSTADPDKYLFPVTMLAFLSLVELLLDFTIVFDLFVLLVRGPSGAGVLTFPFLPGHSSVGILLHLTEPFIFGIGPLR
jgi:hypothetical protein